MEIFSFFYKIQIFFISTFFLFPDDISFVLNATPTLTYKDIFHVNPRVEDMILAFIVDITAFKASSLHITDPHYIYLHGRKKNNIYNIPNIMSIFSQ